MQARANLRALLEDAGVGAGAVEVVDCVDEPQRALRDGVLVTPTLLKLGPPPTCTIVGALSDRGPCCWRSASPRRSPAALCGGSVDQRGATRPDNEQPLERADDRGVRPSPARASDDLGHPTSPGPPATASTSSGSFAAWPRPRVRSRRSRSARSTRSWTANGGADLLSRAQEALARSEARYRDLVTRAPSIVCELDRDGRVQFANEAVRTILGHAPDAVEGRDWIDVLIPPDHRDAARGCCAGSTAGT
jgi:hypothetical protein